MALLHERLQAIGTTVALPEGDQLAQLLRQDLLMPTLQRLILEALVDLVPVSAPSEQELQQLAERLGASDVDVLDTWRRSHGLNLEVIEYASTFSARLQVASEQVWGPDVPGWFLERRSSLDQATLSLVRFEDADLAQELYFQMEEGELTFSELLERYSQDPGQPPRCLVGPLPLEKLHPLLARIAERHPPGSLIAPIHLNDHVHLIRVERLEKASLDASTRQRLLLELRQIWLKEQLATVQRRLFTEGSSVLHP